MNIPLPEHDPFGTDLQLDASGDLAPDLSGSLAVVSQQDNVAQGVRIDLMTTPFTYCWDGDVGTELTQFVDRPLTPDLVQRMQNIIQSRLTRNGRILQLQDIRIDEVLPGALVLSVQALTASLGVVQIPIRVGG